MYAGKVVEEGTLDEIFYDPQHPYTWGLLGSLTRIDRPRPHRLPQIAGSPPSLLDLPEGCPFRPRCPHEFAKCTQYPGLEARLRRRARPPRPLLADPGAEAREAPGRRPDRARGAGEVAGDERDRDQPGAPLLEVTDLVKHFPIKRGILIDREVDQVRAVDGISFSGRAAARRSAWWASPAAASRPPAGRSCS